MNPKQFNDVLKVRTELESMCRNLLVTHRDFSSLRYIVSQLNGKIEIHVEQINEYLENSQTKKSLLYVTHKRCYAMIDEGHLILGVGCILDVLLHESKWLDGETPKEAEKRVRKELEKTPIAANLTAIDSIYSILCTHEGPIIRQQRYYKENNYIRIDPMKEDNDETTHDGLFMKLYPPHRTAKNTFKIMIVDVCLYDPQYTFPGPLIIGHQLVMANLRKDILKQKAAGLKIILVKFPDHSGRVNHFDKSLFDEIVSFKTQPKDREMLFLQIDRYCHLKHNWNIDNHVKIVMGKPHLHL